MRNINIQNTEELDIGSQRAMQIKSTGAIPNKDMEASEPAEPEDDMMEVENNSITTTPRVTHNPSFKLKYE